jgi:hypothetical protein
MSTQSSAGFKIDAHVHIFTTDMPLIDIRATPLSTASPTNN